jgi:hypothetical protein
VSVEALAFRSPHTLREIRELLRSEGSFKWKGGDNDEWGEYLVTEPAGIHARLRVFVDGDRFVIDISRVPRAPAALDQALGTVRDRILPLLDAYEIVSHPGWECDAGELLLRLVDVRSHEAERPKQ